MSAPATEPVERTKLTLELDSGDRLALHRFRISGSESGEPVLLVHGSVENGRIFYSASLKGFAPWLARRGFEVFVLDLRGRGESTPHVSRSSKWGQLELLEQDIPEAIAEIERVTQRRIRLLGAHSWGGVLLSAVLARRPELRERIAGVVCFGSKRSIRVHNRERWLNIDFGWNMLGVIVARVLGYVPGKALGWGSDDESVGTHRDTRTWIRSTGWIDPTDGFDYAAALRTGPRHPRVLHLAGERDRFLGHPEDVRRFAEETGAPFELRVLDYGHVDLLTAPRAADEVYPLALTWFEESLKLADAKRAS